MFARVLSKDPRRPDMAPNSANMRFITLDDSVVDETIAATILGTHHTDYAAGQAFFGNPYRMHRDLMSDAAQEYLNELFPPY